MKKIKILYVVRAMDMGGIENYIMNIVRHIDKDIYQIDFLYTRKTKACYFDEEIKMNGSKIYRLKTNSHHIKEYLNEVKSFFVEHYEYEIVHIHNDVSFCFLEAKQAKKVGVKNVIVHSHNSSANHKALHIICRPLLRKYADVYYACSKVAGDWMFSKKTNQKGLVTIMNNAIDVKKFAFDWDIRSKVRAELDVKDALVLGIVGRLSRQKNQMFLIDIIAELVKKNSNVVLLVMGTGSLENSLYKKVEKMGLAKHVRFLGVRSDISRILSALDYFILPSLYEGLPVVLVEAQASGVQCVISDRITREIEITDCINYVPLEIGASKWAELILRLKYDTFDRECYEQNVKVAGYDIKEATKKLANAYMRMNEVN